MLVMIWLTNIKEGAIVMWGYVNRILGLPPLIRESSMAKFSKGLDYAMMTGGDVEPLGPQAVTKIHEIFDWAKKSRKCLLLFIDEADAFLCECNSKHMSEAQRSALNALLFRTGDQSRDVVLVLATNRPGDLDSAVTVTDRIDEVIEFLLPQEDERYKLLKLYLNKYLCGEEEGESKWGHLFKKKPQKIR
ncbi:P-loop containing nucleoside triphosphate hydrolase superfamily protein [Forsythia ovata]|uniref:P-loop containing nucleoside triphosphate hydrolase superfamily protein n=1 Tax=Forsythia ovata TaxID=205694 RepID=A0ABD1WTK9_9LAMI